VKETRRTGDEGQNFTETVVGDAPCNIEVTVNARGYGQVAVKLYYQNVETLLAAAQGDLTRALGKAQAALATAGIPLANQQSEK